MKQAELDRANAVFWSEVCGTSLAVRLRRPTIRRFDAAYMQMYPWLAAMVAELAQPGESVLEIGPGYGTVGRMLVARGIRYQAVDIAPGVVAHTRQHTSANVLQGNVLELDQHFDAESFDAVCAIGCLHHTGDLPRAITQVHRVVRPGGRVLAMVYSDEGVVTDDNQAGEAAPHTDRTPLEDVPALFSEFSDVQVISLRPHNHTDIYVKALR